MTAPPLARWGREIRPAPAPAPAPALAPASAPAPVATPDATAFRLRVSELSPGTQVTLEYLRDGKTAIAKVNLGTRPPGNVAGGDERDYGNGTHKDEGVLNGVAVGDITDEIRRQFKLLPDNLKGAVITEIDPDSASQRAGSAQ